MNIYQIESLYRESSEVMITKETRYKTDSLTITSYTPRNKDEPITIGKHQGFCRPKKKERELARFNWTRLGLVYSHIKYT